MNKIESIHSRNGFEINRDIFHEEKKKNFKKKKANQNFEFIQVNKRKNSISKKVIIPNLSKSPSNHFYDMIMKETKSLSKLLNQENSLKVTHKLPNSVVKINTKNKLLRGISNKAFKSENNN